MTDAVNVKKRYRIKIKGIVQGVGFRPFIHALATSCKINGWVSNAGGYVLVESEGSDGDLRCFVEHITKLAPPLSVIKDVDVEELPVLGLQGFGIIPSLDADDPGEIYISPDVSICPDCLRELKDPDSRRYLYPLINCTNCGPRFTITRKIPYDRQNTTMAGFAMCDECAGEYADPSDRRYHAQPVSCPQCGPSIRLTDRSGKVLECEDPVLAASKHIRDGLIVAVKGLGGYHLVVNARDREAVIRLRSRKSRDYKPFALMVSGMRTAVSHCHINQAERALLESPKKPIVLLRKRRECNLPDEIAHANPYLGLMLPYTPIHELIFLLQPSLDTLVVTSGNISDEPIYYDDNEAIDGLNGIADYFLSHEREIHMRTDDSVTRAVRGREYIIRRSRGYAPAPVTVSSSGYADKDTPVILACGAHLKNTFCINKKNDFYLSHHIGDLENAETLSSYERGIDHYLDMLHVKPDILAHDMHPDYLSTRYALSRSQTTGSALFPVWHHEAHIASCMADNDIDCDLIGVAFDGTGLGSDGNIWGGEFFTGGYGGMKHAGRLSFVKMPGGAAAINEPWRMAVSYMHSVMGDDMLCSGILNGIETAKIGYIRNMLQSDMNCPLTSSAGRLFDAVSAMLGIRLVSGYEGQAAAELEYAASDGGFESYPFDILKQNSFFIIETSGIIRGIAEDILAGIHKGMIASRFHETMAAIVVSGCMEARRDTGLSRVALSGGVFQNVLLLDKCLDKLETGGFEVFIHHRVPANDGGLSLGQSMIALSRM